MSKIYRGEDGKLYVIVSPSIRSVYILSMLEAGEKKEIVGKTRLMKYVFLLQNELKTKAPEILETYGEYEFVPFLYGPASFDLLFDLSDSVEVGYINEEKTVLEDNKILYKYAITELGQEQLREAIRPSHEKVLLQIAREIRMTWDYRPSIELLRYVYKKYPEYAKKSVIRNEILENTT